MRVNWQSIITRLILRIALIGYMGSGKTTVGRLLAGQMNLPFIDLDECIELQENISITEIFQNKGEAYFRKIESEILQRILNSEEKFVLATGGGTPCFFDQIDLLNKHCTTVYLQCTSAAIEKRLAQSPDNRPLLSNLSVTIHQHLNERLETYVQAKIIVNGELSPLKLSQYIQLKLV
jgi:shikimate kinase